MYIRLVLGLLVALGFLILTWSLENRPPVTAIYREVNDLGVGEFLVTNNETKVVTDWLMTFTYEGEIRNFWGGTVVAHRGNRYVVLPDDRNRYIPGESTVIMGFQAMTGRQKMNRVAVRSLYGSLLVDRENRPIPPQGSLPQAPKLPSVVPPAPSMPTVDTPTVAGPSPTPPVAPPPAANRPRYAEALQKSLYFYEAQRSGRLPANNRVQWRKDSALQDGADVGVDLTGGYYDAGDHVKFALPLSSALTVLAWGGIEYKLGYERAGLWPQLLDTVRWGTDWLMKAHPSPNELYVQVGDGQPDHDFWGPPERMKMKRPAYKITAEVPGSDAAGEAAAALAAGSILFQESDPEYAQELIRHAKELYAFAGQYQGKYSDGIEAAREFYPSSGYWDELAWAAAWLYRATQEPAYLRQAETIYQQQLAGEFRPATLDWDDKKPGVAVLLARLTQKPAYQMGSEAILDFWTVGYEGNTVAYTKGGLAWMSGWGALRYTATTALLAYIYSDTVNTKKAAYRAFAQKQMNYILGENPAKRSYMVGFGPNPPRNPHHRAAHGSPDNDIDWPPNNQHILYGALVGGPRQADDESYEDNRRDSHGNEVTLDYNAGLTGALARMVLEYGGKPLADFPPREVSQE